MSLPRLLRSSMTMVGMFVVVVLLVAGCSTQAEVASTDGAESVQPTPDVQADAEPAEPTDEPQDTPVDEGAAAPPPASPEKPEPEPYVPAGRPGTAEAYDQLIRELEAEVPAELRDQVPWPDLRNPNPIAAQISIFELWIWMEENHPEPILAEVMTAPRSPSREEITSIFGAQDSANLLKTRTGGGYNAFDHLVVTFESAGLPLWLARDVPDDAVVLYYSDNSGPAQLRDRDTGAIVDVGGAVPTRAWLSIMVPTDVGWQLWRDQLIEPNDSELETPEMPPPGLEEDRRDPGV